MLVTELDGMWERSLENAGYEGSLEKFLGRGMDQMRSGASESGVQFSFKFSVDALLIMGTRAAPRMRHGPRKKCERNLTL
jgi:hypothetical protein